MLRVVRCGRRNPFVVLRGLSLLVAAIMLAACASAPPAPAPLPSPPDVSAIHAFLRERHTEDARFQAVVDRPFLKVDLGLRYRLEGYPAAGDVHARRDFVKRFLNDAAAIGERALGIEIAWVSEADVAAFNAAHGVGGSQDPYAALTAAYRDDAARRLRRERAAVDAMTDAEINDYWNRLKTHVEESIMTRGRFARKLLNAPAVPIINGWIAYHNWHDYRGPLTPDFAAFDVYALDPAPADTDAARPDDWRLLRRYAPVIVQERAPHPDYPDAYDHFGRITLTGEDLDAAVPEVAADRPAVYAFVARKTIQGAPARQLNYVFWYPQHPAMSTFDPEAGALDGWTVRITLDAAGRPQIVESVSNCGCYYKIFPGERLEAASRLSHGTKEADKTYYLERDVEHRFDAVVPETIAGLDESPSGIVIYMSAGHHHLVTIRARARDESIRTAEPRPYALAAYDELESLPFGDRRASLFAADGLVRHAHRKECTLLSPSGVYHAGHPRQRETQMIYFDEADFDDPTLLERYLRLPPDALGSGA